MTPHRSPALHTPPSQPPSRRRTPYKRFQDHWTATYVAFPLVVSAICILGYLAVDAATPARTITPLPQRIINSSPQPNPFPEAPLPASPQPTFLSEQPANHAALLLVAADRRLQLLAEETGKRLTLTGQHLQKKSAELGPATAIRSVSKTKRSAPSIHFGRHVQAKNKAALPTHVAHTYGGTITLFARRGNEFVAIASSGKQLAAQILPARSEGAQALRNAKIYRHQEWIPGKSRAGMYLPITDLRGAIIGAWHIIRHIDFSSVQDMLGGQQGGQIFLAAPNRDVLLAQNQPTALVRPPSPFIPPKGWALTTRVSTSAWPLRIMMLTPEHT